MTFKEYMKEKERLERNRKDVKNISIVFFFILLVSSLVICADNCSDTVAEWCISLNLLIGLLLVSIFDKIKERDDEILKRFSQNIK